MAQVAGIARIKSEYLVTKHKGEIATEFLSEEIRNEMQKNVDDMTSLSSQRPAIMKLKGRNKRRPQKIKSRQNKICTSIVSGTNCSYGEKCKFSHDVKEFLATKPVDIAEKCVLYDLYGKCKYGITCRFGSCHIVNGISIEAADAEKYTCCQSHSISNVLTPELRRKLWKRKYEFSKSNSVLERIGVKRQREGNANVDQPKIKEQCIETSNKEENLVRNSEFMHSHESEKVLSTDCENKVSVISKEGDHDKLNEEMGANGVSHTLNDTVNICDSKKHDIDVNFSSQIFMNSLANSCQQNNLNETHEGDISGSVMCNSHSEFSDGVNCYSDQSSIVPGVGCVVNESDIVSRRPKKMIDFKDKLYLAPLTTVGNLPFRRICKEYGADITCGEMAMCSNLLQGQQSEWALMKRHHTEDIFGVQLCGGYVDSMTRCAELLNDNLSVDFVDINCGCPIDFVYEKGEGCGLMGKASKLERIVSGMTSVLDVPLTIKMRTGVHCNKNLADALVSRLQRAGVSMVTIHGRSREQRYTKTADWSYISTCADLAQPMPLFGNGDVLSYHDYQQRRRETSVAGAMIARGALIKPWIFREIKESRDWDISASERLEIVRRFVDYGLEHWGTDDQGVEVTRKFLLEWLSFTYRYIPVGILEHLPQKINEKPPLYRGRNDLETLLSSSHCGDWIKISEMFLGRVPEGFHFLPKHKASAYK